MKLCSVDHCEKKAVALGLCMTHYQRIRRYGDPNYVQQKGRKKKEPVVNVSKVSKRFGELLREEYQQLGITNLRQYCDEIGLNYNTVMHRIHALGWPVKDAVTAKNHERRGELYERPSRRYHYEDFEGSLSDFAAKYGISAPVLHGRIKRGWSLETALTLPVRPKKRSQTGKQP